MPAACRCSLSLTVEHMAPPYMPSLSPGPSPTRPRRDVSVHTTHQHQGQPARKKDKAKTSKTAPPRKLSSLDSLALASSSSPSLPAPADAGEATPRCHFGCQGSILHYVCSVIFQKYQLGTLNGFLSLLKGIRAMWMEREEKVSLGN